MPVAKVVRVIRHLAVIAACGLLSETATADDIDVSKVPPAVIKAANDVVTSKTALKNIKWTAAEKHTENNVVKFHLEGETADEYGVSITVTATAQVEEVREQLDFDKLPQGVKKAALGAVPGIKEADAEVYKVLAGKNLADVTYEVEGEDAKGRYVRLDVSADGKVDEFYAEVTVKELPKAVQDALNTQFAKRRSATCYVVHEKGKLARYDVEVVRGNGSEVHVSYKPDGKQIKD
jgi:uncharacterized protein YxeA